MPKFTWKIDPVFFEIPTNVLMIGLAVGAVLSLIMGFRRKASDMVVFGLALGVVAFLVSRFADGPLQIRYYSLIFVGVFLGGYSLLKWQIERGGGEEEDAGDFIVYGVIAVLVGARLGHVIFYDREKALEDPLWVLQIWTGGLASHGAVIGLIVAMWLYAKRRSIPFLEGADRFSFSAALGATLVRLGNFFNSEIVGRPTDQTWGVQFPRFDRDPNPPYRHPSQLYEFALGLAVLGILWLVDRALGKEKRPRGALISTFFVVYFTGRFGIEFFKEYEAISPDSPLTMGQYLSIPGILIGIVGLWWSFKKRLPAGWGDVRELEAAEAAPARSARAIDADVDEEFGGRRARLAAEAKQRRRQSGVAKSSGKKKRKSAEASRQAATEVEDEAPTSTRDADADPTEKDSEPRA